MIKLFGILISVFFSNTKHEEKHDASLQHALTFIISNGTQTSVHIMPLVLFGIDLSISMKRFENKPPMHMYK